MSMHKIPVTDLERAGLEAHGLARRIGKPDQLIDVFRQGVAWVLNSYSSSKIDLQQPFVTNEQKFKYWEESKQVIKHLTSLTNDLVEEVRVLKEEKLKLEAIKYKRFNNDDCWIYSETEDNHLESLVCPVVIDPKILIELVNKNYKLLDGKILVKLNKEDVLADVKYKFISDDTIEYHFVGDVNKNKLFTHYKSLVIEGE